jgi:hypothetical protein
LHATTVRRVTIEGAVKGIAVVIDHVFQNQPSQMVLVLGTASSDRSFPPPKTVYTKI